MRKTIPIVILFLAFSSLAFGQGTSIFSPSGSRYKTNGTTSRTLAARQSNVYDPIDFGAKADGATNDASAIAAAINAATATKGKVYLRRGTYAVTTSIPAKSNVTIEGDGDASIIKHNAANVTAITIGSGISNFTMRNLVIDGNRAAYDATANDSKGIYAADSGGGYSNIRLEGLTVKNTGYTGILLQAASGSTASGIIVSNCLVSNVGGHGICVQDYVSNVTITGCRVVGFSRAYPGLGGSPGIVAARSGSNAVISNNYVEGDYDGSTTPTEHASAHGISVDGTTGATVSNNVVKGCIGYGIEVGFVTGGTFTGNLVYSNYRTCIGISGNVSWTQARNYDITITGNTLRNSANQGVYVFMANPDGSTRHQRFTIGNNLIYACKVGIQADNIERFSVTGNTIVGCTQSGIYVTSSNHALITGNIVEGNNTSTNISHAGIFYQCPSSQTSVRLVGNDVRSNGTQDWSVTSATSDFSGNRLTTELPVPNIMVPLVTNGTNFGSSSLRWSTIYGTTLDATGATIGTSGLTSSGTITASTNGSGGIVNNVTFSDPTATNLAYSSTVTGSYGATTISAATRAMNIALTITGSAGGSAGIAGVNSDITCNQSAGTLSGVYAVNGTVRASGVGTVSAAALRASLVATGGALSSPIGVEVVAPSISGSGSMTGTPYGIKVGNVGYSGLTSAGLRIEAQSGGTSYAIDSAGGQVRINSGATGTTPLLLDTPASPTARYIQGNVNGAFRWGVEVNGQFRGTGNWSSGLTVTANHTIALTTAGYIRADATSGAITIALPSLAAVSDGANWRIKKIDSSGNAVTIARNGSDTIEGATSYSLASQYKYVHIRAHIGSGNTWEIWGSN